MTFGFEPPEGDPDAVDAAVRAMLGVVPELATQNTTVRHGFDEASETWRAPRKGGFDTVGRAVHLVVSGSGERVDTALDVMQAYARRLRNAHEDVEHLRRQADSRQQEADDAARSAAALGDPLASEAQQQAAMSIQRLRDEAAEIREDIRRLGEQTMHHLDSLNDAALPGAHELSPEAIARQVHAASGLAGAGAALANGTLTEKDAWAALASASRSLPPDQWRTWAAQYGFTGPLTLDQDRALRTAAELDDLLEDTLALDPKARAAALAAWAKGKSEAELVNLAMFDPARIGNLDGMPNTLRYAANKVNLAHGVDAENAVLGAWKPPPSKDDPAWVGYDRLGKRIKVLKNLLHDKAPGGDLLHRPAQILAFTPPTYDGRTVVDDGRLAAVFGDLDKATHVGVVVPGIENRIDNFIGTWGNAESIQQAGGDGSATVAWLGYDTPGLQDSVLTDDAESGGEALAGFVAGLQRAGGSDLTLAAHSYGTLVTSKALQLLDEPAKFVDRVVLFGSPGLGENVHSTADLGLPPGYPIYALRASGDPVSILAAHGLDPVELRGITRLDTGPEISGHSHYAKMKTLSWQNIGAVLRGDLSHLATGGPSLDRDGLLGPYNGNLRSLIDQLQAQASPEQVSRFVAALEPRVALAMQSGHKPGFDDIPVWTHLVRSAAKDSGLSGSLTHDEFEQAVKNAGFTDRTGDLAGGWVRHHVDDLDGLDNVPIPVVFPGSVLLPVRVPAGVNEAAGHYTGALADWAVTGISNKAVDHLPHLSHVLDAADTVWAAEQTGVATWNSGRHVAHEAVDTITSAPGKARHAAEQGWDQATDTGKQLLDEGGDLVDDLNPF